MFTYVIHSHSQAYQLVDTTWMFVSLVPQFFSMWLGSDNGVGHNVE